MKSFLIRTKQNLFRVEAYSKFVERGKVKLNEKLFEKMCKEGCVNYGKKYSCPPFVPDFRLLMQNKEGLHIILFKCDLKEISSIEYNKIRIANVSMKSRIIKLMRFLENKFDTIFLSTGACNLCKSCKVELNKSCKYPDKKRYSLEAVGIDCDDLCKSLFKTGLLWYKNKKAPQYSCVVCGLICDEVDSKKIKEELNQFIIKNEI
jgi:predicted metal-binding protein